MTIAHRFLDRRALTKLHAITDVGASVSPDGRQIAFGRGQAHEIIGQVYMMNADRSGAHAVPSDLRRDGWI